MARILVVDDDIDMVEMYRLALEKAGHEVTTACSGEEGRKELRRVRPDLAVIDVMMETAEAGFILGREAHAEFPSMEIIFLSSVVKDIDERVGIPNIFESDDSWLKTIEFFDKPIDPSRLVKEIDSFLARKQE